MCVGQLALAPSGPRWAIPMRATFELTLLRMQITVYTLQHDPSQSRQMLAPVLTHSTASLLHRFPQYTHDCMLTRAVSTVARTDLDEDHPGVTFAQAIGHHIRSWFVSKQSVLARTESTEPPLSQIETARFLMQSLSLPVLG